MKKKMKEEERQGEKRTEEYKEMKKRREGK